MYVSQQHNRITYIIIIKFVSHVEYKNPRLIYCFPFIDREQAVYGRNNKKSYSEKVEFAKADTLLYL